MDMAVDMNAVALAFSSCPPNLFPTIKRPCVSKI
jgi:hypothetical protein